MKKLTTLVLAVLSATIVYSQTIINPPNPSQQSEVVQRCMQLEQHFDTLSAQQLEASREYKLYKRWLYFWQGRLSKEGTNIMDPTYALESYDEIMQNISTYKTGDGSSPLQWEAMGPFNDLITEEGENQQLGRVECAATPSGANFMETILIGTPSGGIWKTTDGGDNWVCTTDDDIFAPGLGCQHLVYDPNNNSTVYAALTITTTGQVGSSVDEGYGLGIYKSTDGGDSWNPTNFTFDADEKMPVYKILINPDDSNEMYAAVKDKIYRTNDGWSTNPGPPIFGGENSTASLTQTSWMRKVISDMEVKPGDFSKLYISSIGVLDGSQHTAECHVTSNADAADPNQVNWTMITGPLQAEYNYTLSASDNPQAANINIAVMSDAYEDHVFLAFEEQNLDPSEDYTTYIYRSTDDGATFDHLHDRDISGNARWQLDFEVSPNDPDIFYVSNFYPVRVEMLNNGTNSNQFDDLHIDTRYLKIVQGTTQGEHGEDDVLLYCTDGGISELHYDEINDEMTGTNLNGSGLCITQFHGMGLSDEPRQKIIGGAQDNSNYIFRNNQWENYGGNDRYDVVFYSTGNGVIPYNIGLGGASGQVLQGYTNGVGQLEMSGGYFNSPISGDPHIEDVFYGGGNRFRGCTFESNFLNNIGAIAKYFSDDLGGKIRTIAVSPVDNNYKFMAYGGDTDSGVEKLYYTKDEADLTPYTVNPSGESTGMIWHDLTSTLDGIINNKGIRYIACDPLKKNVIWLGMEHFNSVGVTSNRVLKLTIDENNISNSTVEDFSNGLPNTPVNILRFEPGKHRELWCGNDIGVYKLDLDDPQGPTWHCKTEQMPVVFVSDIEFDAHNHEVYISTFGRGVWKADLPCDKLDDYVLTEDETWPHVHLAIHSDVIVPDDVTLTITGTVGFGEHCGIIVEPGGELIVDGGHLTSACGDELWTGVQVIGQDHLQQTASNQGWVFLDSAKIENAHTGVWLRENDDQCNYVEGTGGGVVRANNSTFLNCYVGIQFAPYLYEVAGNNIVSNTSQINNCDFLTTRVLNGGFHPLTGLYLEDNFRVPIRGCTFENKAADPSSEYYDDSAFESPSNRGWGIRSHSTVFSVGNSCTETDPQNNDCIGTIKNCSFKHLTIGVFANDISMIGSFDVHDALFENNIVGIRSESMFIGPSIVNNTFHMQVQDQLNNEYDEVVGIDIDQVTGFEIEENKFYTSNTTIQPHVGIAFTNTGMSPNELYRNEFDGLGYATLIQDVNGDIVNDIPTGLQIKCNKYGQDQAQNFTDVYLGNSVANTTINPEQGSYQNGSEIGPAANLFSHNCPQFSENDYRVNGSNSDTVTVFNYYEAIGVYSELECYSEDFISSIEINTPYSESNLCPTNLSSSEDGPNLTGDYEEYMLIVEDVSEMYKDSIDKGDTQSLVSYIKNAQNSSIQVRNEMISCVPYISFTAWEAAFERNPAMDPWHLSQVLLAASPLDQRVIQMMKDSDLDPYYKELVEDGQNGGMTHKMILENDMASYRLAAAKAKNDYLRKKVLWADSSVASMDSIKHFLENISVENETVLRAAIENRSGNYTQALALLGDCKENGKTDDLCVIQKIIAEAKKDDQFCPAFTQQQINDLQGIASDEQSPAYTVARSVLMQYTDSIWPVNIRIPADHRSMALPDPVEESDLPQFVKAHPNPAGSEVHFTTQIPEGVTSTRIVLSDGFGKKVWEKTVEGHQIIPLNLSRLTSGIYIYTLYMDGTRTESHKLIISK